MARAWTDIPATAIDQDSFVTEGLLADFESNQEALITQNLDCRWAEVTTIQGAYTQVAAIPVFIPPAAGTDGGNKVTLVVVFEVKTSSGTTSGNIRLKLGAAGSYQAVAIPTSDTAYTRKTVTISAADVNAAKGTEATLYVEMQRTAGTGTLYSQNAWGGASRLERAA